MVIGIIIAVLMCLAALVGLALVAPSVVLSWRVAPVYYNVARIALPLITLTYFGPRLLGLDFPGREGWVTLVFLGALGLIVVAIMVYLYREPGDTHRRQAQEQPRSSAGRIEAENLIVRTALAEDLPGAGAIFAEAFHQSFDLDFGPDRKRNGRLLGELLALKQCEVEVAVAPETGQIVGAMWLDLGDKNVPSMTFGRSWPILRQYLNWLHAAYFALYALPAIMARRGTEKEGYIQWLGVDPEWQGRGVGRHLVARGVELSEQAGKESLSLHTERSNERARKLYTHMGFIESSPFSFSPRVRYVKNLSSTLSKSSI